METAEPVSYDFPGHAVGGLAPRRVMNSHLGPNLSFYPNVSASFSMQFQPPVTAAYHFSHALNGHHPGPYQQFYVTNHQSVNPQPVRLSSEPPPFQLSIPDIRPAKNAVNRSLRVSPCRPQQRSGPHPSPVHHSIHGAQAKNPTSPDVEFSTEVDVLMKAIQSKVGSQPSGLQPLPSLQQLTHGSSNGFHPAYAMPLSASPPRYPLMVDDQVSRSGKKRKYTCTLPHCGKSFAQKTHLDIHTRAHTGDKPFVGDPFPTTAW